MRELNKQELIEVKGGASKFITAAFITSLARAGNMLLDLGRSLGTSIRRLVSGNVCSI